jgi:hypothetical protein
MAKSLAHELTAYQRERVRLEREHPGRFVLLQDGEITAIFNDFRSASEHAARLLPEESYLIHRIGTELTCSALAFLDEVAAISENARELDSR